MAPCIPNVSTVKPNGALSVCFPGQQSPRNFTCSKRQEFAFGRKERFLFSEVSQVIGRQNLLGKNKIHSVYVQSLKSRKENPQKLTQLSSISHPRHLVGKRTAQKDITIDTTSDSQVNSNFPNRWSPASLTFNNYFYLFLYLYIT